MARVRLAPPPGCGAAWGCRDAGGSVRGERTAGEWVWGLGRPREAAVGRVATGRGSQGASACPFGGLWGGGRGPAQRAAHGGRGGLRGGGMSGVCIEGLGGTRMWAWVACVARAPAGGRGSCRWASLRWPWAAAWCVPGLGGANRQGGGPSGGRVNRLGTGLAWAGRVWGTPRALFHGGPWSNPQRTLWWFLITN